MKKYILTLACVAAMGATAQVAPRTAVGTQLTASAKTQNNLTKFKKSPSMATEMLSTSAKKMHALADTDADTDTVEYRNSKLLTYWTTTSESGDLHAALSGISASELSQYGCSGWGYAAYYPSTVLTRYYGNKITKVNIVAFRGNYSDAYAFIGTTDSNGNINILAKTDIALEMASEDDNTVYTTADFDYTIPENCPSLIIGWMAEEASLVSADQSYSSIPVAFTVDNTGSGNACIMVTNYNSSPVIYTSLSYNGQEMIAPVWAQTEGDGGVQLNDIAMTGLDDARGLTSRTTGTTASFVNLGLAPVSSVDYSYTVGGKTVNGTQKFSTPIPFMNYSTISIDAPVQNVAGTTATQITINNVNGTTDEFDKYTDNEATATSLAFDKGYKRVPVAEVLTNVNSVYAVEALAGIERAQDQTSGRVVTLSAHCGLSGATDNYTESNYDQLNNYYLGADISTNPVAVVNREYTCNAFYELPSYLDIYSQRDCEASLGMKVTNGLKGITATTTVNITSEVPDSTYSLIYVVSEKNVQASEVNIWGYVAANYPNQLSTLIQNDGDEDYIKQYSALSIDANYASTMTENYLVRDSQNLLGDDESSVIEKFTPGESFTSSFTKNYNTSTGYTKANMSVAALLVENRTGRIITGVQVPVGSEKLVENAQTGVSQATVDAAANFADIDVENGAFRVKANGAKASVYDAQGRLVSSAAVDGEVSLPTFGHGTFIIRVTKGMDTISQKAVF